ncbi:transcriptional regulator [Crenobacter sp. SG2303]|uniref:Transcriptional regulator n=1 Tax=Crenobacter oryzisoli TaxID=3056844 RepID=A0ABT7XUX1_9NEIS|nr:MULTISPECIES: transcriptional regulator [unclassified Crenobacter]MDN0077572.1 transcriptional regulator [Crenobacter sp. SG2303]MDN0083283.1 transcriptional regulator [Crenobacter sp. SG2305]
MTKATYTPFNVITNPRDIRRKLGMKQQDFWSRIGVTQSGGSRYESGRNIPKPVRELLRVVHVEQIDLADIKREDFDIAQYLRETHPDLYRSIQKAVLEQRNAANQANEAAT